MTENKILVTKDREEELFFAAIKDKYDEENERTIIGYGSTETEAMQGAVNNILKANARCIELLESITESLGYGNCLNNDNYYPAHVSVPRPSTFNENTESEYVEEGFSALHLDNENGLWYRFYR